MTNYSPKAALSRYPKKLVHAAAWTALSTSTGNVDGMSINYTDTEALLSMTSGSDQRVPIDDLLEILSERTANPHVVGGSFASGCSIREYSSIIAETLRNNDPARLFLPRPEARRGNTHEQLDRCISKAFPQRTVTTRSDYSLSSTTTEYIIHLSSEKDVPREECSLSEIILKLKVEWASERVASRSIVNPPSALSAEDEVLLLNAVDQAEGELNSRAWQLAYRSLCAALNLPTAWHGAYLVTTSLGSRILDSWAAVARACKQRVGRADQPAALIEFDLGEELSRQLQEAQMKVATASSASRERALQILNDTIDSVAALKLSIGLSTDKLDETISLIKAEWSAQQASVQPRVPYCRLTPKGQELLHRGGFKSPASCSRSCPI